MFYEDETDRSLKKVILDRTVSGEGGRQRMAEDGPERVGEKVAIVTAAGSGMGAACARELASRGYAVALISPSDSRRWRVDKVGLSGGSQTSCTM